MEQHAERVLWIIRWFGFVGFLPAGFAASSIESGDWVAGIGWGVLCVAIWGADFLLHDFLGDLGKYGKLKYERGECWYWSIPSELHPTVPGGRQHRMNG